MTTATITYTDGRTLPQQSVSKIGNALWGAPILPDCGSL
jgi:hypothetical protein